MMKKAFIPNWYIDKKNEIRNKRSKRYIMMILIVNICLLGFILNISNKTNIIDYERDIKNNNTNIEGSAEIKGRAETSEVINPDIIIIEKYKEISSFFKENNLSYKNIIINKDNVEVEIKVKSYEEYIVVIKCIEAKYSIKKLIPNSKNKTNFDFKVIVEV